MLIIIEKWTRKFNEVIKWPKHIKFMGVTKEGQNSFSQHLPNIVKQISIIEGITVLLLFKKSNVNESNHVFPLKIGQ